MTFPKVPSLDNISVETKAYSISAATGQRIWTGILKYPRFIHAEFMTHRMLSRNAASSRAIPVKRMIDKIQSTPAMPEWWGATQRGMQAFSEIPKEAQDFCRMMWLEHRDDTIEVVNQLLAANLHKQIANRLLEPWSHITVLCTATCLNNFFALRAHPDAQPEFQVLAYRMLHRYLTDSPKTLLEGEWHLPFGDRLDDKHDLATRLRVSTARAARLSYETFDGDINIEKDIEMHDDLERKGHWSPFEHPAMADASQDASGNFRNGFRQYRTTRPAENRSNIDLEEVFASKPDWIELPA